MSLAYAPVEERIAEILLRHEQQDCRINNCPCWELKNLLAIREEMERLLACQN
jgi:hypothetical protein